MSILLSNARTFANQTRLSASNELVPFSSVLASELHRKFCHVVPDISVSGKQTRLSTQTCPSKQATVAVTQ
jgi:hypothetical protein